jgi:DNA polymerase-3 subunit alpha
VRAWPARHVESEDGRTRQGLAVRLRLQRRAACAEIDLGDEGRFWPSDEALARWKAVVQGGNVAIVYDMDRQPAWPTLQ